jgi:hypothetical protein
MKSFITIGIVALTAVAAGEGSAQTSETWRLSQVDGAALPAVVEQDDDDGCREELVSGTLTLEADGRWKLAAASFSSRADGHARAGRAFRPHGDGVAATPHPGSIGAPSK